MKWQKNTGGLLRDKIDCEITRSRTTDVMCPLILFLLVARNLKLQNTII